MLMIVFLTKYIFHHQQINRANDKEPEIMNQSEHRKTRNQHRQQQQHRQDHKIVVIQVHIVIVRDENTKHVTFR